MNYISDKEIDGRVDETLLEKVNNFITVLRSIFNIHCFTKGKHSKNSYHYKGKACDGHSGRFKPNRTPTASQIQEITNNLHNIINKEKKSIYEQSLLAYLSGLNGVGIYPNWKPISGLHLDIREKPLVWVAFNRNYLLKRLAETEDEQIYFYLT